MAKGYHGIKPVYDRKTKTYKVFHLHDADPINCNRGYFVTDNLGLMLGKIVAGKCEWYNKMKPEQQVAVFEYLKSVM